MNYFRRIWHRFRQTDRVLAAALTADIAQNRAAAFEERCEILLANAARANAHIAKLRLQKTALHGQLTASRAEHDKALREVARLTNALAEAEGQVELHAGWLREALQCNGALDGE